MRNDNKLEVCVVLPFIDDTKRVWPRMSEQFNGEQWLMMGTGQMRRHSLNKT